MAIGPALITDQNILPVQAYFNLDGSFNTFLGQGQPFVVSATESIGIIDTTVSGTFYPTFSAVNTGQVTTLSVTSTKLSFNPSTGVLTANGGFVGSLNGIASIATNLQLGGANTLVYQSSSGNTAYLTNGTTGQVLTATTGSAPSWTTPTFYASVTDDTTTNTTRYPLFANQTSGSLTTEYTSSTKYQYNPSTGTLSATIFSGSGASLTSIPNSALTNSSITLGSTAISLGGTATTIAGLTSVTSTTFVGALTGNASTATSATTATNATNIGITDNTSSSATWYPTIVSNTTGNLPATTSSTKLSFVPSTGTLNATVFSGSFTGSWAGSVVTVPYGGTGLSSLTANYIPYGNGTSAFQSSSNLQFTGTNLLLNQSYDQGTGVLQVTGQSTFNGAVTDKSLNLQGGNNLVLNSATLVTQNITVTANTYTLSMTGTGTITLSGTSSGTLVGTGASTVVSKTFTPTAGTLTLTPTGSCTTVQLELGSVFSGYTATGGTAVTTTNNINVPSGQVITQTGTTSLPAIAIGQTNKGFISNGANGYVSYIDAQASNAVTFGSGISVRQSGFFAFSNSSDSYSGTWDTFLYRDSANTLAQRNSTNAQTFRLYNTYTDASNYERLSIDWSTTANTATIGTQAAGTGTNRTFVLSSASAYLQFSAAGAVRVVIDNAATAMYPQVNNSYDLGYSTLKWRNAYIAGVVTTNSDASINGQTVGTGNNNLYGNLAVGSLALAGANTGNGGNSAFGLLSLNVNTSGQYNAGFGQQTLYSNKTGSNNLAIGSLSLTNNVSGSGSTASGYNALYFNTTASSLTAYGYQSLYSNTTNVATLGTVTGGSSYTNGTYTGVVMTLSSGSTAITYPTATIVVAGGAVTTVTITSAGVGFKDTTTVLTAPAASIGGTGSGFSVPVATLASGTGNVAVGYQAGYSNSVGTSNTFNGYQAGFNNTTGGSNAFYGYRTGYAVTTGSNNTAVGANCFLTNISGNFCVVIGSDNQSSSTGSNNTSIGYGSLYSTSSGASLTAVGRLSLRNNTTGSNNIAFGDQAGYGAASANANTTGSNNTYIGYQTVGSGVNNTNEMVIGYQAVGLGSNTTVIGNTSTTLTQTYGVTKSTNYTVATLPSASTSGVGARAFVTDALAPVFGSAVAGGGAVPIPVYSTGSAWYVG